MPNLDETDLRILRLLQADGRITNQALAARCHLSPAACHERVRRLRAAGVIPGYAALLDPQPIDRGLLTFVAVPRDPPPAPLPLLPSPRT